MSKVGWKCPPDGRAGIRKDKHPQCFHWTLQPRGTTLPEEQLLRNHNPSDLSKNHWDICGQEDGKHIRSTYREDYDHLHRWPEPARSQCLGGSGGRTMVVDNKALLMIIYPYSDHQWAIPRCHWTEGVLQFGQAWRLHQSDSREQR